ncbi:hypothetical protein K439DRAFT_1332026 [Ramaria rubella]|nr:hypothetical protein K439DRAFT_1332026 [Ramaria rubella]
MERTPPVVLTIAGTDPSGGAGIQADLKTFTSLQCYGTSVVTALVAQNTLGVQKVHAPPPAFIETQLRSVLDDLNIKALKTGMLFNDETIAILINTLETYFPRGFPPLVVDPVCVSTSGHSLLDHGALTILRERLVPLATIITPNISEAELLLSGEVTITSIIDMLRAAKAISSFGPNAVLLKGGHVATSTSEILSISGPGVTVEWAEGCIDAPNSILILAAALQKTPENTCEIDSALIVDVLYQASFPDEYTLFVHPRVETRNTHGTGCTLSAALVCELAGGNSVIDATRAATRYTHHGITTAFPLGRGNGPLNHLHGILERKIMLPNPSNPHPFISAMIHGSYDTWQKYVKHPFVTSLGEGTLQKDNFIHFIKQDYHYLKYYGRVQGLIAAKSTSFDTMRSSAGTMLNVARETSSHMEFCKSYGVSFEELLSTVESPATTAYGAYLIDVGLRGDETQLMVAVAACLLGYGEVGLWLVKESEREGSNIFMHSNPYERWIKEYAGENYQEAVRAGIDSIESRIASSPPSPSQLEEMRAIWERCTRLEIGFWDMALHLA